MQTGEHFCFFGVPLYVLYVRVHLNSPLSMYVRMYVCARARACLNSKPSILYVCTYVRMYVCVCV